MAKHAGRWHDLALFVPMPCLRQDDAVDTTSTGTCCTRNRYWALDATPQFCGRSRRFTMTLRSFRGVWMGLSPFKPQLSAP